MKIVQIIGLAITTLAVAYYLSFADRLNSIEEQGSVNLGIGLVFVFVMAFVSAVLLVPSSFILWRKKTRAYFRFDGVFWNSLLIANSALAVVYTGLALWFVISFFFAVAGS